MGHHGPAVLRDPLRRDPGVPRRQAQDRSPDCGHFPLPSPAVRCGAVAGLGGPRRNARRRGDHRVDRRRICHRGDEGPSPGAAPAGRGTPRAGTPRAGTRRTGTAETGNPGGMTMTNLHRVAGEAVAAAVERGITVATAESLTAGMVTAM